MAIFYFNLEKGPVKKK